MVDFLGWDRRSNSARPSQFIQGVKSPHWPNFALKMYPIKQSHCSIARRNPATPEHHDVKYGVEVGWTWRICFIAPRSFVGGHGWMRMRSTYVSWCKKWVLYSTILSSCRWMGGHLQWIAEPHYQTLLPRLWRVDPQVMSQVQSPQPCKIELQKKWKKKSVSN